MRLLTLLLIAALGVACATPGAKYMGRDHDEVVAYQVPLEVTRLTPTLQSAQFGAPSFQFACDGTARRISPPSGSADYTSITVWAGTNAGGASATPVFVGGEYSLGGSLVSAATTTLGMPLCSTSSCAGVVGTYEVRNLQCITGGGNVTVTVQVTK